MPLTPTPPPVLQAHPSKHLLRTSYDKMAPTYLQWTTNQPSPRLRYLEKLMALLPASARVLELGCGAGVPCTQLLTQAGHHVIAVDISEVQLDLARSYIPSTANIEFVHGDMTSLNFPEGSFDAVVGFYSIIHLPASEQGPFLQNISHWLKAKGLLVANFATMNGDKEVLWLGGERMFWGGLGDGGGKAAVERVGIDLLEERVEVEVEDGREVSFWWVLGRKGA